MRQALHGNIVIAMISEVREPVMDEIVLGLRISNHMKIILKKYCYKTFVFGCDNSSGAWDELL